MKRRFLIIPLIILAGCASRSRNPSAIRPDRNTITAEQIKENHFQNAYEAVAALHANWLEVHGTDSFVHPSEVQVYYDATRLGTIDKLQTIQAQEIAFIRWYDGTAATTRYGVGHSAGVILVATHLDTPR